MDDLVTWLRAQLDDDEAEAQEWPAVLGDPPTPHPFWLDTNGHPIYEPRPRRLAEVDAKRRILDEHNDPMSDGRSLRPGGPQTVCGTCREFGMRNEQQPWPCNTLRYLALPYADRPGYRDEWKP